MGAPGEAGVRSRVDRAEPQACPSHWVQCEGAACDRAQGARRLLLGGQPSEPVGGQLGTCEAGQRARRRSRRPHRPAHHRGRLQGTGEDTQTGATTAMRALPASLRRLPRLLPLRGRLRLRLLLLGLRRRLRFCSRGRPEVEPAWRCCWCRAERERGPCRRRSPPRARELQPGERVIGGRGEKVLEGGHCPLWGVARRAS